MDVAIDDGRIEDVLKLAVTATTPVMTGRMQLRTKLLLPAGDLHVIDRLDLAGTFKLNEARFTNVNIQEKIYALSRRSKGEETAGNGPSVVSRLSGNFTLRGGTLTFSDPSVWMYRARSFRLLGTYDLKRETLDFRGHLLLDATLAETTSGWKAVLKDCTATLPPAGRRVHKLTHSDSRPTGTTGIRARCASCARSRLASNDCR